MPECVNIILHSAFFPLNMLVFFSASVLSCHISKRLMLLSFVYFTRTYFRAYLISRFRLSAIFREVLISERLIKGFIS